MDKPSPAEKLVSEPSYKDFPQKVLGTYAVHDAEILTHQLLTAGLEPGSPNLVSSEKELKVSLGTVREMLAEGIVGPLAEQSVDEHFTGHNTPETFHNWKKQSEQKLGRKMSWTDWLARQSAESGVGATDEQLLNVLQWSIHRLEQHENGPNEQAKIQADLQRMERRIEQAVADGILSPALLEQFRQNGKATPAVLGDIFDQTLGTAEAYNDRSKNLIVMREAPLFSAVIHERLHSSGGFSTKLVDEGVTDILTLIIEGKKNNKEAAYQKEVSILVNVLRDMANLTWNEVSELYAGENSEENTQKLHDLIQDRTGADVLGYILAYQQSKFEQELVELQREYDEADQITAPNTQPSLALLSRDAYSLALIKTRRASELVLNVYKKFKAEDPATVKERTARYFSKKSEYLTH